MSRTNRFLGGLGLGYLQQIIIIVTGLWLTPFLLHRLGQHDYGLWLIITQAAAYLGLLDLGIIGLLPRETAAAVGRAGPESPDLPQLVGRAARIVLLQFPIVAACSFCVWLLGRNMWRSAESPLRVLLIAFVLTFPFRLFSAVLQGLQDLVFLGRVQIASWALTTAASIALVINGRGLMALALSSAAAQLVTTLACWSRLRLHFPGVLPDRMPRSSRAEILAYMKKGAWISTSQVAQMLTMGSDVLLVGKLLGAGAVVPYSCTGKLAGVLANKPQMMMQVAFPGLSELRGGGSKPRIRRVTIALSQVMLSMSGAVACVVLAANRAFVDWWIGPSQFGGGLLTLTIVVAMLVRHWNMTFGYSLFCFGYERRLALTGLADGCVTVVVSIILVSLLGPIGAPLGMLTGICLVDMPANLMALGRELETSPFALLASSVGWLGRFLLASIGGMLLSRLWHPQGLLGFLALALIVGSAYFVLIVPVLMREPLGSYIRPRLLMLPEPFQRIVQLFPIKMPTVPTS